MKSVELFSGCGGLALGLSRAGVKHELLVERDVDAVKTLMLNRQRGVDHVCTWNILNDDVAAVDWSRYHGAIDLVAGGPPCQPFSIGGKHRGHEDRRDMWPETIRAVREIAPTAFLFENVRGLTRQAFAPYLQWITESLKRPTIERKPRESHARHLLRLKHEVPQYDVAVIRLDAADYGAPQHRHRVIIVGVESSRSVELTKPPPTHSSARLEWDQCVSGSYWKRHRLKRGGVVDAPRLGIVPDGMPWVTVRDALKGLGPPNGKTNHAFQDGARIYIGHTGSPLDLPAKALKAGDHGVPGGENMMVRDDGSVRYFTIREAARLQGLPDDFLFDCAWSESMRQLGNAVPAQLSEALGRWLIKLIGVEQAETAA
jgi:DNA (cytosine-5)-methyltransferase 1